MYANARCSGPSVVPLFPDRVKNGETARSLPRGPTGFNRERVLSLNRHTQLKAEVCGRLSVALRMVRLQARAGCARPRILYDLRRLQLMAEASGQWSAALTAIELQRRLGGGSEKSAAREAPHLTQRLAA